MLPRANAKWVIRTNRLHSVSYVGDTHLQRRAGHQRYTEGAAPGLGRRKAQLWDTDSDRQQK